MKLPTSEWIVHIYGQKQNHVFW